MLVTWAQGLGGPLLPLSSLGVRLSLWSWWWGLVMLSSCLWQLNSTLGLGRNFSCSRRPHVALQTNFSISPLRDRQGEPFLLSPSKQPKVFTCAPGQQGLLPLPQWPQAFVSWETKVSARIKASSNLSPECTVQGQGEELTGQCQHLCVSEFKCCPK